MVAAAMADGYTIKHRDEFETMEGSGDATWRLARKALAESAFGFNLVEIAPGGQIPEHDEEQSGQHELFLVLEGEGTLRLNGEDHPSPAGTFASIEPPVSRTILNRSDAPVTALLIGVSPDGGYEPPSWA
jgi:quercetin dioxygenase-like cupin family protein